MTIPKGEHLSCNIKPPQVESKMANDVFANGLEIACKSGAGKSIACFPDVCFTPPSPPAGWIPIPYPNTSYAKDTSNASKTVFISGKPIMKKDVSFFKTSTGNEPAAGPKGIVTGVKKGKAYFTSWSMNVKIEGKNVDRHSDGMTHNHGSKPGNTGIWHFLDTADEKKSCKNEFKKVEKACGGMKPKKKGKKGKKGEWVAIKNKENKIKWKKKHCKGLLVKPVDFKTKSAKDMKQLMKQLNDRLKNLDKVQKVIHEAAKEVVSELTTMGIVFAAKQVAKKVPVIGWIWQIVSIKGDIEQVRYLGALAIDAKAEADRMTKQVQTFKADIEKLKINLAAGNFDDSARQVAEWMRTAATLDSCTRARKCMLVPMEDTDDQSDGVGNPKGCCPGQTGHHLIPGSYIKSKGEDPLCDKYKYKKAPVVCAEGTGDTHGSHGAGHLAMNRKAKKSTNSKGMLDYDDAVDAAVKSHLEAFPLSMCSPDCIRSQLNNYHKTKAKCADNTQLIFVRLGPKDKDSDM